MTVSKRLRFEILRRDNHACRYCGRGAPEVKLTVDHVIATTLGGTDDPGNLVAACADCNSGKSSMPADAPLVADVNQDAIRWANAMRRATELALAQRDDLIEIEKAVWDVLEPVGIYLPGDWFASIEQFVRAGLAKPEILDAAQIAVSARVASSAVWRYFCGVCWKKVSRRQEAAHALIDAETPPTPTPPDDHLPLTAEVRYAAGLYYSLAAVCDAESDVA